LNVISLESIGFQIASYLSDIVTCAVNSRLIRWSLSHETWALRISNILNLAKKPVITPRKTTSYDRE